MGFQCIIGGDTYNLVDFSAVEASTPLASGDTSGQVGTINLTVSRPDPYVHAPETLQDPNYIGDPIFATLGSQMLVGRDIRLTDSRKGFTLGRINSVTDNEGGTFSLVCDSRLGLLNVYGVQAPPIVGTLSSAFSQYLALAGVTTDLFVDPDIAQMPVVFPGWSGELWYHLKQMAAAVDADVSLVSGIILLRPIRERVVSRGRETNSGFTIGGSLAQYVEVYRYDNQPITNELVYPPGGWTEDVPVINVNAGETVEEVLELSASVSSIQQPTFQTFVSRGHDTSSVYTVVGDDGLPITSAAWTSAGGRLSVAINPDTVSLTVTVKAPVSPIPNKNGEPIGVFSISLSSELSTGRYSTLRILGSGVSFNKQSVRFSTGVTPEQSGTEVGETIDNPFLSTLDQLYTAGTRAARRYKGTTLAMSAEVISVNQLGDSGAAQYPLYADVQATHTGRTYGGVKTFYAGKTYGDVQQDLFDSVRNDFENQVFGNVAGARIYNKKLRRWFRTREGSLSPGVISVQADDDLTHKDVQETYAGSTYGYQKAVFSGLNYRERNLAGLFTPDTFYIPPALYPAAGLYPATNLYPKG